MNTENKTIVYTQEFKESVVSMVIDQGQKGTDVAKRLGVEPSKVFYWVRQHRMKFNKGIKSVGANSDQIRRLENEVRRLTMERDILKKAAAYFAKFPE